MQFFDITLKAQYSWNRHPATLIWALLILAAPALAQFRTVEQPSSFGTADLKNIRQGYVIPQLVYGEGAAWDAWSSSFLEPSGEEPAPPEWTGDEDSDMEEASYYSSEVADWNTMYSARSLTDGDTASGWSEGVAGNGIGEVVIARVPDNKNIGIMNGFQRSASLYAKNARPRRVRVWLMAAESMDFGQFDDLYYNVKALASLETELADRQGWQPLPLPSANAPPTRAPGFDPADLTVKWFVAIQILSVYPGSAWQDTCISEIGTLP
ncbi:MAG: hypothetical protein KKC64_15500 [Spirochaetes bacterium]|nr:hypothetical protein [Spirochaetota bacterium]